MKHWHRRFPIYDSASIHLIISDDIAEAQNKFKDVRGIGDSENCRGFSIPSWPNFYIFLRADQVNKRTLAHEIFHTVMNLMREVGVPCVRGNDEAYAYMADWLTGWAYARLGEIPITSPERKLLDKARKRA